jgi:hypothetical protein
MKRTVIGQEANVHKDGLVLGRCPGEGGCVQHLPCHGGVGVAAHIGTVAFAGAVPQLREDGASDGGSPALWVVALLPLLQLRPHHLAECVLYILGDSRCPEVGGRLASCVAGVL